MFVNSEIEGSPYTQTVLNDVLPPLVLMVRRALLSSSERLSRDFSGMRTFEIIEKIEEILKSWDINLDVSTEPLLSRPFLLIRRQPLTILLYTRSKVYEVWPGMREVTS